MSRDDTDANVLMFRMNKILIDFLCFKIELAQKKSEEVLIDRRRRRRWQELLSLPVRDIMNELECRLDHTVIELARVSFKSIF
jgi:hypothetical protein